LILWIGKIGRALREGETRVSAIRDAIEKELKKRERERIKRK
jgi:hypothetical protein